MLIKLMKLAEIYFAKLCKNLDTSSCMYLTKKGICTHVTIDEIYSIKDNYLDKIYRMLKVSL